MLRNIYICLMIAAGLFFVSSIVTAQEFSITTGNTTTNLRGAAFDGTNYLIGIQGDAFNSNTITAQLVSASGSSPANRISLNTAGKGPLVSYDGTNYLLVWSDITNAVYGQFLNTSGSLVGSAFTIAQAVPIAGKGGCIAFGDSTYMVVHTQNDIHYGQRVSKSGSLVGTPIRISINPAGENSIAFDGTNYLVVFRDQTNDKDIYGQFVSKTGVLVGSNFMIDNGPYLSDNPVSVAFDGSQYFVAFHEQAANNNMWNLFARFVTPAGIVAPSRVTIRDSTYNPGFPLIAFDGINYLITWTDNIFSTGSVLMGRYFNKSGVPVNNPFSIFQPLDGKVPYFGIPIFGNNKFLTVTFRVETSNFTNGDVYGKFVESLSTGLNEDEINLIPNIFSLSQNYPNPFNPSTIIKFSIPKSSFVTLKVFDLLGREVATLVNEEKSWGNYKTNFDGSSLSSGIYFYRLQAGSFVDTKKLIFMK
ncbi:MAG: T9SS type A sorting domain-containing protein [Melioribacteraceae bacterium]